MTNYREILRLKSLGINNSQIATSAGCTRRTVINVLKNAEQRGLRYSNIKNMSDRELASVLSGKGGTARLNYKMPDYDYVHKELAREGVTLGLLWIEYCETCRLSGEVPYQSTQFNKYYSDYVRKTNASMAIHRKPGESIEVDWAGNTFKIKNAISGNDIDTYIFVAVLSYSGYAYVEAFLSMEQENWIQGHIHAFNHFCGITRLVIPDNLKTGVTKNNKYETIINKSYNEMAEHYNTAIVPARVRKPKDKPNAEGTVRIIGTWIMAALRNEQYFSLSELNTGIKIKLKELNEMPFQKKEGSRRSMFLEEKPYLIQLPKHPFELATWKVASVQNNYHIECQSIYYSVPYEYIGKKVDVRITKNVMEIFYEGLRICSHKKSDGYPSKYITEKSHMPQSHQNYGEWNSERFLNWAKKIGTSTEIVIKWMLSSFRVEEQSYKSCMALLKLSDKYSMIKLEAACSRALQFTPRPSLKTVQNILKSGQENLIIESESDNTHKHGFTRGAGYYGGDGND